MIGSGDASAIARKCAMMPRCGGFEYAFEKAGGQIIQKIYPPLGTTDYSPYVTQLMTSNNGGQPDQITCLVSTECIQLWSLLQAQGFKGIFQHVAFDPPEIL